MSFPVSSYNRRRKQKEILASITFESRVCSAPSQGRVPNTISPTVTGCGKEQDTLADTKSGVQNNTNEATALVILCMKEALNKSIQSISLKSKERALDARVDFSFKTKVYFKERKAGCQRKTRRRHTVTSDGVSCCGVSQTKDIIHIGSSNGKLTSIRGSGIGNNVPGRIPNKYMMRDYDGSADEDDSASSSTDNGSEPLDTNINPNPNPNPTWNVKGENGVFARLDQEGPRHSSGIGDIDDVLRNGHSKVNSCPFEEMGTLVFPETLSPRPSLIDIVPKTGGEQSILQQMKYNTDDNEQTRNGNAPDNIFPNTYDNDRIGEEAPRVAFTFTDYSPMCYSHIRQFFGVKPREYRDVLVNSGWHNIPTPGKSAAQLFFCGQNWVIKTMTKGESKFLRSILHRYYNHVRDHPHTLLPHFVGHHSLRLENGEKMTFVIMQNVFATTNKIREKFDLKGSTVGRVMTEEEKKVQTSTKKDLDINRPIHIGNERREKLIMQLQVDCEFLKECEIMDYSLLLGIHPILKGVSIDNNNNECMTGFGRYNNKVSLVITDADGVVTAPSSPTLRQNSVFPTSRPKGNNTNTTNITGCATGDIHKMKKSASPFISQLVDEPSFTTYQGGMLSENLYPQPAPHNGRINDNVTLMGQDNGNQVAECREIYYVGIIDILQQYNSWKRSETFIMGMRHMSRSQISSVSPCDYANRFVSFMSSIIV